MQQDPRKLCFVLGEAVPLNSKLQLMFILKYSGLKQILSTLQTVWIT